MYVAVRRRVPGTVARRVSMRTGKKYFLILGMASGFAVTGGCSKSDTEKLERDAKATGRDLQKTASDAADATNKAANEAADKAKKAADDAKKAADKAKTAVKDATKKTN
jgi:hypothetical protein